MNNCKEKRLTVSRKNYNCTDYPNNTMASHKLFEAATSNFSSLSHSFKLPQFSFKNKILIVTVGEQEEPLYEGLKLISQVTKIYFVVSDYTEKVALKIKENVAKLYTTEIVKTDEKELDSLITKLTEIHRKEKNAQFFYNLTGGTKIMSLACLVVASFLGENAFYIFKREDGTMQPVEIPILRYNLNKIVSLGDKRHKILVLLNEKSRTITELASLLRIQKATVSGHIDKLHNQKLIEKDLKTRNNQSIGISKTGCMFLSLLEVVPNYG